MESGCSNLATTNSYDMVKAFRVPDNYSFVLWWNMWAVVLYRGRNGRDFNVKNPIFTAAGSLNACVCVYVCVCVCVCVWWQWGWGPLTLRQLPGSSSSVSQSSCQVNLPSRETFLWTSLFPSSGLDKFLQPQSLSLTGKGEGECGGAFIAAAPASGKI